MSDASALGFGKCIPGFEFLQNLGQAGAGAGGMPPLAHWVASTLNVEEIEKRIDELKAVQFWLEQNSRALSATVQALEVQRMTLSTLKGMNINLGDRAQAFPFAGAATAKASPLADWPMPASAAPEPTPAAASVQPEAPTQAQAGPLPAADTPDSPAQAAHMAQALQWWGALTQQFQHIAQQAMQEPAQQQAMLKATQMGAAFAQTAVKTASDMVAKGTAATASPSAGQTAAKTPSKHAQRSPAAPAAPRKAPAKKVVRAEQQPRAAVSPAPSVAAKKSALRTPRSR